MKNLVAIAGWMMVTGMVLTACSGASCPNSTPKPGWIDNPPVLGAVGYKRGTNVGVSRTMAEDDGRHKLAREISVKVSGLLEQSLQQVMGPEGETGGHEYAEGITRTMHKQFLSGSRVASYWTDCDGGVYALVTIERESLMQAANEQARNAANKLMKHAEEKHAEFSKKFNDLLEKEYGE